MLRARLGFASHMEAAAGASTQVAPRVPRVIPCFAKPTVEASVVCLQVAQKVPKEAHRSARHMVEESVAYFEVESAPRACMEGPTTVLHMEVESVALCQAAPRALGAVQTAV